MNGARATQSPAGPVHKARSSPFADCSWQSATERATGSEPGSVRAFQQCTTQLRPARRTQGAPAGCEWARATGPTGAPFPQTALRTAVKTVLRTAHWKEQRNTHSASTDTAPVPLRRLDLWPPISRPLGQLRAAHWQQRATRTRPNGTTTTSLCCAPLATASPSGSTLEAGGWWLVAGGAAGASPQLQMGGQQSRSANNPNHLLSFPAGRAPGEKLETGKWKL